MHEQQTVVQLYTINIAGIPIKAGKHGLKLDLIDHQSSEFRLQTHCICTYLNGYFTYLKPLTNK